MTSYFILLSFCVGAFSFFAEGKSNYNTCRTCGRLPPGLLNGGSKRDKREVSPGVSPPPINLKLQLRVRLNNIPVGQANLTLPDAEDAKKTQELTIATKAEKVNLPFCSLTKC